MSLSRGAYHREFDVRDVRKKTARYDPVGIVSKEMAKIDVRRDMPKMTSAATTVPRAFKQYVRNRQSAAAYNTKRTILTISLNSNCIETFKEDVPKTLAESFRPPPPAYHYVY